jgi:hypothetical protein
MAGGGNGTPLDYEELERWTRVGYEWGMPSRKGEQCLSIGSACPTRWQQRLTCALLDVAKGQRPCSSGVRCAEGQRVG